MHRLSTLRLAIAAIGLSMIVIMPSHADGDEITDIILEKEQADDSQADLSLMTYSDASADTSNDANNNDNSSIDTDDQSDMEEVIVDSTDVDTAKEDSPTRSTSQADENVIVVKSPNKFLPTFSYSTENLSATAKKVNEASWKSGTKIDRNIASKLQALLNWHQNGVGGFDGLWGKNTRKAMQAFQIAQGLSLSEDLNDDTWQALNKDNKLATQPVLVNYQLTDDDVNVKTTEIPVVPEEKAKLEGMYYETLIEALAEKFHMDEGYLKALNPNISFKAGETITVYNPGRPNTKAVTRVVANRATETLYAYDDKDVLVASYPTTVGSTATPSPTGIHTVKVKVYEPNYTYTHDDGHKSIIPPGPNNPVGSVWIGLSKPSYGIHGSPDPARISRQASAGCVRLTNWDALALLGTIENGATVEFQ